MIRVTFDKCFVNTEIWREANDRPWKALHDSGEAYLPAAAAKAIQDAWGFNKETEDGIQKVVGLLRVAGTPFAGDAVDKIISYAGTGGVAIQPLTWPKRIRYEHERRIPGEEDNARLARALVKAPQLGVELGRRQIPARYVASETDPISRVWQIDGAPRDWTDENIISLLKGTELKQPEVVRSRRGVW